MIKLNQVQSRLKFRDVKINQVFIIAEGDTIDRKISTVYTRIADVMVPDARENVDPRLYNCIYFLSDGNNVPGTMGMEFIESTEIVLLVKIESCELTIRPTDQRV